MTTLISPRLRWPLVTAMAGVVFAAAWIIRGGHLWWVSIVVVVTVAARVVTTYVRGGRDNDFGALAGSRVDERLRLLRTRSQALAGVAAMIAAFVGLTIAVAVQANWWWPFLVILAVAGFGYLFGLSTYGVGDEGPADDADVEPTRSPVSR
jgi:hypothetical protein